MNFAIGAIDTAIILFYLGGVVAFGLWIGRGKQDLSGYLLGGRNLPWWAILGSIVATETSTATFLSVPGIAFAKGGDLRFLQLAIGFIVGRLVVSLVLLPHYFQGELYTAYEVLNKRFGGLTKQVASILFLVTRNLGDGLRLLLAGIALDQILGLNLHICIILIGIATILYTFFGGMKAVIWSDCAQFVVYMVGGALAGLLLLRSFPGGWQQFLDFARTNDKLQVLDFGSFSEGLAGLLVEPFSIWSGVIGGAVLTLGTHGTDQMMVQRYLCARSEKDASRALILSGWVVFLQFTMFLLLGVALACYYQEVEPQKFERNDEVFATFIVQKLPVGLVGLTLAAVFAAAMSTLSSSLNSSATSAVNDLYAPALGKDPSSPRLVAVSRVLTVIFGIIQIAVGIGASYLTRSVVNDALAIAGFTAGILLGIFALGVLTRRVGQTAALAGMAAGLAVLTSIKFATPIAWPWYAVFGAVTTFVVGYLASFVLPAQHSIQKTSDVRNPNSETNSNNQ